MNNNYFHQSKIINKKIINSELCFVEFKVENWNSHVPGQYSEICNLQIMDIKQFGLTQ